MPNCIDCETTCRHQQAGYTIIELIIAIQISLMLIAFAFAGFQFMLKMKRAWQDEKELNSAVTLITRTLTKDIHNTKRIVGGSSRGFELETLDGKQVRYQINQKQLERNSHSFLPESMQLDDFEIIFYRNEQKGFGLFAESRFEKFWPLREKDALQVELIQYSGAINYKNRSVTFESSIAVRPDNSMVFMSK